MVRGYVVGKATVDTGGINIITHTLVFGLQILRRQFPFQKTRIPIGSKVHRMHERGTEIAEAFLVLLCLKHCRGTTFIGRYI